MGLGPPVCKRCMIVATLDEEAANRRPMNGRYASNWSCSICKSEDLGSLFEYTQSTVDLIYKRTRLFAGWKMTDLDMKKDYICTRPFMTDDREPNVKYRPWLEEHAGKQGIDWDWGICRTNIDLLEVFFRDKELATLFELTWP